MIRIVADSSTLYSVSEGKTKGINIAPLSVTIDNRTYKEFEEIQSKEFVLRLYSILWDHLSLE